MVNAAKQGCRGQVERRVMKQIKTKSMPYAGKVQWIQKQLSLKLEITANPMEAIAAKTPSWMICDSSIFIVDLLLIIAM